MQLALSNAHFWAGDALRRKDDPAGTLKHFQKYLEISELLAARHRGDDKYEAEVSYGHANVGAAHEMAGDLKRALAEYQLSIDINRKRLQSNPASGTCLNDLAKSLNRVAVVQQNLGELRAARATFEEELALRRQLLDRSPNDARSMSRLAVSLGWNGLIQQITGDDSAALTSWREELRLAERLNVHDPKNLDTRRHRCVAQSRVAWLTPEPKTAAVLAAQAVRELRQVVTLDPHPARRIDLAYSLIYRSRVALAASDAQTAMASAREAREIVEPLAAADPRPNVVRALAEALLAAADAEERGGDREAARLYRTRVTALRANGDLRLEVLRARALTTLGRSAEAAPLTARLVAAGFRDPRS